MAEKLIQIYKLVNDELGMKGKMDLAIETKIPSTKASFEPDSPENLNKFKQAYEKLTGKRLPAI